MTPGAAVVDDLGYRTAPGRDDRRPARHRLDHHQPERLLPVDRRDERARAHEQLDLVRVADLADVLDRPAEMRADELVEVADLERLAALRGDLQREPGLERDGERAVRSLVRAHASEEDEVVAAGLAAERIHREIERVRAVRDPGKLRLRLALVHRDGDEPRVRREVEHLLVHAARLAVERAVHGVTERDVDQPAEREPEHARVVVEDVELLGLAERVHRVLHLPVRVPDPLARRRVEDGLEPRARLRVARREERHVVARVDEAVREERDDAFGAAVRLRRDGEPHWADESYSHLSDPPQS